MAQSRQIDLQLEVEKLRDQISDSKTSVQRLKVQLKTTKAHIESLVKVMVIIMDQIVQKCQVLYPDKSRSHNQSQISDFCTSQLSSSTDQFDKSFEDDRRNLIDSIRNVLVAKIQSIQKTVNGLKLGEPLECLTNWKIDIYAPNPLHS